MARIACSPWPRAKCRTPSSSRLTKGGWLLGSTLRFCDGGACDTFIDWRGYPTVFAAASKLRLIPLNLIVWAKTNGGIGSLYRSQHELLPLFKKDFRFAREQRRARQEGPLALERLDLSRSLVARLRRLGVRAPRTIRPSSRR